MSMSELMVAHQGLIQNFVRSGGISRGRSGCNPDWKVVERVIARRGTPQTQDVAYLVKWTGLNYSDSTWVQEADLTDPVDMVSLRFLVP